MKNNELRVLILFFDRVFSQSYLSTRFYCVVVLLVILEYELILICVIYGYDIDTLFVPSASIVVIRIAVLSV